MVIRTRAHYVQGSTFPMIFVLIVLVLFHDWLVHMLNIIVVRDIGRAIRDSILEVYLCEQKDQSPGPETCHRFSHNAQCV